MPNIQFSGPRAKLRAVRRHYKVFRDEMNRYIASNKGALKIRVVPPSTEISVFAHLLPLPEDMSVIIGEIAHQLRSSLDLLACDLAKYSGATKVNDVYFPIARTKEGYFDKRSQNKIAKLLPDLRQAINDLKPYDESILVALNALDGADKHQQLLEVIPSIQNSTFAAYLQNDFQHADLRFRRPDPSERGEIEILRFPANSQIDSINLKLNCRLVFTVEPIVGKPVSETLPEMARTVEGIIGKFEALCTGP